jgi:predicted CXXCH cytochrome family protein
MVPLMTNAALPPSQLPTRRAPWVIGIGAAALVGLACYGWLRSSHQPGPPAEPPDPDPRLTADTPFLNVRPDVAYVGDEVCASCHKSYAESYGHNPMSRSLRPVADAPADTRPEGNPFKAMGLQYRIERRGGQVFHREVLVGPDGRDLAVTEAPVRYALGSGTRAVSYLIDHDGTLTQSPITWFEQTKSWDVSPGFKGAPDRFERPIQAACLFCHCNQAEPDADTRSAYREPIFRGYAIGCERCHGPGALHVRAQTGDPKGAAAGPDYTIVNPFHLKPALQEAVCAQCHLGGKERVLRRGRGAFDFRPGLPLESFLRVFAYPPTTAHGLRVAGHVEQLHASRCFQASAGKLGCTSCHDPHDVPAPEGKGAYYRARCLQCHKTQDCTEAPERRQAVKGDDCTACHMPREGTDISHVALTDHRIPRRPEPLHGSPAEADPLPAWRLLPFGQDRVDTSDPEMVRDWAVAVVSRAKSRLQGDEVQPQVGQDLEPLLAGAVEAHPDDLSARESLAICLAWQGQAGAALEVCEGTLAQAPRREQTLCDAGVIALKLGLVDRSLDYWRRALAVNPWSARYRFAVAQLLSVRGDWEGAAAELRRALALNGSHALSRLLLVKYYLRKGEKGQARAELETALALHPPNEAQLRKQFAELLR